MPGNCGVEARCFRNSTDWFREEPNFSIAAASVMVNKIDRPNMTPTVHAICRFAVYFSVFRPFCCFTLLHERHFVLCYKEKTRPVRSC